jgi:hypothetical protein
VTPSLRQLTNGMTNEPKTASKRFRKERKLQNQKLRRKFYFAKKRNFRKKISETTSQKDASNQIFLFKPGLSDFSWYNIPKQEKICQITINYTKWPQN